MFHKKNKESREQSDRKIQNIRSGKNCEKHSIL